MNNSIRAARYPRRIRDYSSYSRTVGSTYNNGKSVLAKKIIVQSLVCIVIIFLMVWIQSLSEEFAQKVVSHIRLQVVERNITPNDIYQSFSDTYEECVQYLQGAN